MTTVVLKLGGRVAAGGAATALELAAGGHRVCVVHGAGPQISAELERWSPKEMVVPERTAAEDLPKIRATISPAPRWTFEPSAGDTGVAPTAALVTATALFRHLRLTFRALWKHEPPLAAGSVRGAVRETILEQATSFLMVLTAGALLIVTLGFIAVVHWLSGLFSALPQFDDTSGALLGLPIPLALATLTFALLFKFLPPVRLAWRHVWLAAVLCGIAWVVGADLLALYASFGDNSTYGAIGGLLVVMVWMKFVSQVLFYGAEVCKVVATRSAPLQT